MVWQELGENLELWYRRSDDLGLTWQEPVLVNTTWNGDEMRYAQFQQMKVDHGVVHVLATEEYKLVYYRSTDGKTFTKTLLPEAYRGRPGAGTFVVRGNEVFISFKSYDNILLAWSVDGGITFEMRDLGMSRSDDNYGIDYDGTNLVVLTSNSSEGKVTVLHSSDKGQTFTRAALPCPVFKRDNGETYTKSYLYGGQSSELPIQHMQLCNGHCYVIYGSNLPDGGWTQFLHFVSSDDGGKTWNDYIQLATDDYYSINQSGSTQVSARLVARGDDVYVVAPTSHPVGGNQMAMSCFHSHDCGKTFEMQDGWVASTHARGHFAYMSLVFDPTDPTGQTIYITSYDYGWAKTTDGFRTISEVSFNDCNCPGNTSWHQYWTQLQISDDGVRHWFVAFQKDYWTKRLDVIYRRDAGEPAPSGHNKSFRVGAKVDNYISNRALIPANANYHSPSFTAEMWVKVDDLSNDIVLAYQSHGYDQDPNYGWMLLTRTVNHAPHFLARMVNDKNDEALITPGNNWYGAPEEEYITAGRWYHLALTYDSPSQKAMLYVNGRKNAEAALPGYYDWGWNPIIIGHSASGNDIPGYEVDNFRIWNRALTAEEVRGSMTDEHLTTAEGLRINLGFDDTLADLSGWGNYGYGMSDVTFVNAARQQPQAMFNAIHAETGEVVFANHSTGAVSYRWHFGDGTFSDQGQPTHTYKEPGEYVVSLEAFSATASASTSQMVVISGLAGISPTKAGNAGTLLLTVMGGGLTDKSKVSIRRGGKEITAEAVALYKPGILRALLSVDGIAPGPWDVVVDGVPMQGALTIEESRDAEPWMNITGRSICLYNKWQTYTVHYGNKGNVDAYNVPLNIFISHYPTTEVECIDFGFSHPYLDPAEYGQDRVDAFYAQIDEAGPTPVITDKDGQEWVAVNLIVPVMPAGSSGALHIRVKSPDDFVFRYWTQDPWGLASDYDDEETDAAPPRGHSVDMSAQKQEMVFCMMKYLLWGLVDAAADFLDIGCAYKVVKTVGFFAWDTFNNSDDDLFGNLAWNTASAVVSCTLGQVTGAYKAIATIASFSYDLVANSASVTGCGGGPSSDKGVSARGSWDPNEMVGPSGYRDDKDQYWIRSAASMPYTILFENKAEATAPAHTVFVSDTLDLTKYDLDGFNFTSVGWGNNIVNIPGGNRTEFVQDIDLRPGKPFILRTSGKLYPETGIVEWNFITLNPETMEEEEDPEIGFLPPNDDNHSGEGFVSFVIGQKHLASGTTIANQASIVFDANAPILTNTFVNAIDDDLPTSAAYLVTEEDGQMKVQWSGSDKSSGVAHYEVWMCKNGADFENISNHNPNEYLLVDIEPYTTYGFFTLVTDNVGNLEDKSPLSEVTFTPSSVKTAAAGKDARLQTAGRNCEIILPQSASGVRMTVQSLDGRTLSTQELGTGDRWQVTLPTTAAIVVVESNGQKFVWKVAGK